MVLSKHMIQKVLLCALLLLPAACEGSREAERVERPVVATRTESVVTTDLGYTVTVTRLRAVVRDLRFTTGTEAHAGSSPLGLLVGTAWAHPGHGGGGETLGELPGQRVVDWLAGDAPLGLATLLPGRYGAFDFTFARGGEADGLTADDPLRGNTFDIAGEAEKDGHRVAFTAAVALDEGADMVGAPFDAEVSAADATTIAVAFVLRDPFENDTVFDGIDFLASGEPAVDITADTATHNRLRRVLRTHDHYLAVPRKE